MTWTHNICEDCWNKRNPDRQAVKLIERGHMVCCFCGAHHASGIYVRHDPNSLEYTHDDED